MPHINPELVPDADADAYEVVFRVRSDFFFRLRILTRILQESEKHHLAVHNTEVDGVPAYATGDLVERHNSNPSLFRILGRKDNQIMLSTGEKVTTLE